NYVFFAIGFSVLARMYKLSTVEKLLWLSFPTVYMMSIPYTEALFFLLMSGTCYGIIKKRRWLIWVTLFLATLTRPTGIFLLPALLIMELIANHKKEWYRIAFFYLIDYAFPIVAGLGLFIWYQHYAVGIWFAYFIQQQKYQGHVFNMPILPFSSLEGPRNLWISALALFCCFISIIVVVKKVFNWLFRNIQEPDKLLVLSCVFFGATLYKTIFYNPIWGTGTTLTIGLHRYVFATPFFYIFLYHFTNRVAAYKVSQFLLAFVLCNIAWLSCGAYLHIQFFLYFNCMTLIVFLYMLHADKKLTWPPLAIMALNVFFQVIMFQQYLNGLYLD
ncbi:MAG TPA: hypothetical protein VK588_06340, partial [Chitinophagaceae bacterium]|nr:hypothetical protein [Chitinophagaceae bacterium]